MHFDDRLDTVLRTPLRSDAARRTQYRQLVDILGHSRADEGDPDKQEAAYERLGELGRSLTPGDRAAILRDPGMRLRHPRLVTTLAAQEPEVADAAIASTRLPDQSWLALIPALPPQVRHYLKGREDLGTPVRELLAKIGVEDAVAKPEEPSPATAIQEPAPAPEPREAEIEPPPFISRSALGLDEPGDAMEPRPVPEPEPVREPLPEEADEPLELTEAFGELGQPLEPAADNEAGPATDLQEDAAPEDRPEEAEPAPAPATSRADDRSRSIGDLVRRIETFRSSRDGESGGRGAPHAPRLPLDERQDEESRIKAIEFSTDRDGRIADATRAVAPMVVGYSLLGAGARIARSIRRRLPIVDEPVDLPGAAAIEGRWQLDAMPVFDPEGGRFLHFRGRLRRPGRVITRATKRAEKLRQLLHELRTPVNAIQGFAEAIQQQVFGDVPHSYRAYAATIASDSAAMMAGFEELDRFARLTGGEIVLSGEGCDLSTTITATLAQLATYTQPRVSGFKSRLADPPVPISMDQPEGERLVWRLLGTLAGETAPGEFLNLRLTVQGDMAQLAAGLPRRLSGREGDKLFEGGIANGQTAITAGMFGSGFALRLARAEAQATGGTLERDGDELVLTLPMLTAGEAANSDGQVADEPSPLGGTA